MSDVDKMLERDDYLDSEENRKTIELAIQVAGGEVIVSPKVIDLATTSHCRCLIMNVGPGQSRKIGRVWVKG